MGDQCEISYVCASLYGIVVGKCWIFMYLRGSRGWGGGACGSRGHDHDIPCEEVVFSCCLVLVRRAISVVFLWHSVVSCVCWVTLRGGVLGGTSHPFSHVAMCGR